MKTTEYNILKTASNEYYITVLAQNKAHGKYAIYTKNNGNNDYNSTYHTFRQLEQA